MNRYSKERQYTTPRSPYDMDFIAQAMDYKQSKVDANRAMIQQNIDQIVGLDIDKAEAREYLNKRVEGLLANVNQYGNVDLSSDGIARNIASYIGEAIDDTVINAYAGTMEGRKMEKYYDDLMLNDPDKYNERNKAFAMAPYYQWLQDGKAGSRLAPLQVSNYVDYRAEAEEVLKQVREAQKGGQEIQYPDPNNPGYMITEKIDQMTEDQIQQIAYNMMSEGAKKQMYVDGWYMSQTQPDLFTNESLNEYVSTYNQSLDRKRDALKASMAGAISDTKRYNELMSAYQTLTDRKDAFNSRARQIFSSGDISQMGAFMVENNFLTGLGKAWSYSKSTIKYSEDAAYWKGLEYERNIKKDQEDASFRREELKLKKAAEARQASVAEAQIAKLNAETMKLLGKAGGVGGTGINLSDVGTVVNETMDTSGERVSGERYMSSMIDQARKDREQSMMTLVQLLDPNNRKELQAWIEEKKESGDPDYVGLSDGDMALKYFEENGGAANDMLSYGDARSAYLAAKESELLSQNAMKAVNGFTNFQRNTMSSITRNSGGNAAVAPTLALAGFVDHTFDGIITFGPSGNVIAQGPSSTLLYDNGPERIEFQFDAESIESPSMVALIKSIGEQYGYDNLTSSDIFNDADGVYYLKNDPNHPVISELRRMAREKSSRANSSYGLKEVAARSIGNMFGPSAGLATEAIISSIPVSAVEAEAKKLGFEGVAYDIIKNDADALYDQKQYDQIADDSFRTMTTPLGYIVHNDDKIDSPRREVFNTLMSLYVNAKGVDKDRAEYLKKNMALQESIVATSVVGDNNDIRYGLYINGNKETFVEINKQDLINNGIAIEGGNVLPVESIPKTEVGVFFPDENDVDYARQIKDITGLTSISSKTDMFNDIVDRYPSIFKAAVNEDTGDYTLTPMGAEMEELVLGADKFDVGIQGYKASGVAGLKVFLYGKSQSKASRQPVYQYSLPLESGNAAYRWLQACPQYYIYRAYNMAISQYQNTKMRGSEAGKAGFNKMLNVVRK